MHGILGRPQTWLPEHVEFLGQLFSHGESPATAALALNAKFKTAFTRNAVIGKAHRNHIEIPRSQVCDPRNIGRRRSPRPKRAKAIRNFRPPRQAVPDINDQLIPFEQRKTIETIGMFDCRWPVGDPCKSDFFFCGAPKLETSPYCAAHHQRGHNYESPKRAA